MRARSSCATSAASASAPPDRRKSSPRPRRRCTMAVTSLYQEWGTNLPHPQFEEPAPILVHGSDAARSWPNPEESDVAGQCMTSYYPAAALSEEGYTPSMPAPHASAAIASATFHDLTRRPGVLLAATATAV